MPVRTTTGKEKKQMDKDAALRQKKRLKELSEQAIRHNAFYFTDFMTAADAAEVYDLVPEQNVTVFGGAKDCERVVVRFGNPEEFGYEEPFPITLLKITPAAAKFADDLTHRDYLGTLMGLGIDRDVVGDIIVRNNTQKETEANNRDKQGRTGYPAAYVFILTRMAGFVVENLTTVKHTTVTVTELTDVPKDVAPIFAEEEIIVSSQRLDGVIAKLFHLSREKAKQLFAGDMVFINGRTSENPSLQPKMSDVISVRGYGKFIFDGVLRETKKGNTVVSVRRYV